MMPISLTQEQAEHFYTVHGRIQDDSRNITESDLKYAVNIAYAMTDQAQNRIDELESLLQSLLDAEGVICTSHNRQLIKDILNK
jgi:hypothetical protein